MSSKAPILRISQRPDADALLSRDPLALLIAMLLDQQVPMERAFSAPHDLAQRLGLTRLDATALAAIDPDELVTVFKTPPALHRFPGAMAARVQNLCTVVRDAYDGDAEAVWRTAESGAELAERLGTLPGFGAYKARIFLALLGKRLHVTPPGWREAAGEYGRDGTTLSVADVDGPESLKAVREAKKAAKAAKKSQ